MEHLKSLEFYKSCKNIIIYGGTGTGKTMLSICIDMERPVIRGFPRAFIVQQG
jgi:DNA replication protein DnaC